MKYTEDHEWLSLDGDIVTVGITEYAAEQLGDVVFVELPETETMVAKGDEIVEINEKLVDNPALVNEDPLGEAWFFKLKIDEPGALDAFMDEDAYKEMVD